MRLSLVCVVLVGCGGGTRVYPTVVPSAGPDINVAALCGGGIDEHGNLLQGFSAQPDELARALHWSGRGRAALDRCHKGDIEQVVGVFSKSMNYLRYRVRRDTDIGLNERLPNDHPVSLDSLVAAQRYVCSQPAFLEAYNRERVCLNPPHACLPLPTCAAVFENAWRFIYGDPTLEQTDLALAGRIEAEKQAEQAQSDAEHTAQQAARAKREAAAQEHQQALALWSRQVAEGELKDSASETRRILAELVQERKQCLGERARYLELLERYRRDYEQARADHERMADKEVCDERAVTSDMVARARSEQGAAAANQIARLGSYTTCRPLADGEPFPETLEAWVLRESKVPPMMVAGRPMGWRGGPVKVVPPCIEDLEEAAISSRARRLRATPSAWPEHLRTVPQ